jgi:hypothetical protein
MRAVGKSDLFSPRLTSCEAQVKPGTTFEGVVQGGLTDCGPTFILLHQCPLAPRNRPLPPPREAKAGESGFRLPEPAESVACARSTLKQRSRDSATRRRLTAGGFFFARLRAFGATARQARCFGPYGATAMQARCFGPCGATTRQARCFGPCGATTRQARCFWALGRFGGQASCFRAFGAMAGKPAGARQP